MTRIKAMPPGSRRLIVNADDFGQSPGVNEGVIRAHECGIVTSASLMVRWPAAKQAAQYGRAHASLSLGLHFDLAEWSFRDGGWMPLYQVVAPHDDLAVAGELERQLQAFSTLLGRPPTHLDSHQHVHREEAARALVLRAGSALGIPVRGESPVQHCGAFYGQTGTGIPMHEGITVDALIDILKNLPAGTTELACHPGEMDDTLDSMYREERTLELAVLCNPQVARMAAELGIELASFGTPL